MKKSIARRNNDQLSQIQLIGQGRSLTIIIQKSLVTLIKAISVDSGGKSLTGVDSEKGMRSRKQSRITLKGNFAVLSFSSIINVKSALSVSLSPHLEFMDSFISHLQLLQISPNIMINTISDACKY